MDTKALFGFAAIALTITAFLPYIYGIVRGTIKPHVFSWILWGLVTFTVFLAQMSDGAGAGGWAIGVSGILTWVTAYLAYTKRAAITITRSDWIFFLTALSAFPLWYAFNSALIAVIILTTVDVLAFIPTIRKAYHYPFDEAIWMPSVMIFRGILSLLALEAYTLTTALFLVVVPILSISLVGVIVVRRYYTAN